MTMEKPFFLSLLGAWLFLEAEELSLDDIYCRKYIHVRLGAVIEFHINVNHHIYYIAKLVHLHASLPERSQFLLYGPPR